MATTSITLKELHGAVGAAVKAAADRHKVRLESNIAIGPGTLVGPRLRAAGVSIETAQKVAEEITEAAAKTLGSHVAAGASAGASAAALPRPGLQSGFVFSNNVLICGFWPGPWQQIDVGGEIQFPG